MLNKHTKDATVTVKCVVRDCIYNTKSWATYRQYCKYKHNCNINNMNLLNVLHADFTHNEEHEHDRDIQVDTNDDDGGFEDSMLTGKFVLYLEAVHKVLATAVDMIVSSTRSLVSDLLQSLSRRVLSIPGIHDFQENRQDAFHHQNSLVDLNDLTSHACRQTFNRDHFMLIPPEKCLLSSKYVNHNVG